MIPAFDHNGVLPPFLVDPRHAANCAPYPSAASEICQKWGSDASRRAILRGFLDLRRDLVAVGILDGFQWLDGSFMEDCENLRGRSPGDIDVVTFYPPFVPTALFVPPLSIILASQPVTRATYHVDHVPLIMAPPLDVLVDLTRFWHGLFSHRKVDFVWKGMLRVPLNTPADDANARLILDTFGTP
jgi:hypothetical protein